MSESIDERFGRGQLGARKHESAKRTQTPRTDAEAESAHNIALYIDCQQTHKWEHGDEVVRADFARSLELEAARLADALGTLQRAAHALAAWSEGRNALHGPGTIPPEVINECREMERIARALLDGRGE